MMCEQAGEKLFMLEKSIRTKNIQATQRQQQYMYYTIIGFPPGGFEVDHINGNGLDNRRENLRFVTPRQNKQNKINITTSSKYLGVCWHKNRKKWIAGIKTSGKLKHLGYFTDEKTGI